LAPKKALIIYPYYNIGYRDKGPLGDNEKAKRRLGGPYYSRLTPRLIAKNSKKGPYFRGLKIKGPLRL